ncbi:hypothetical protein llap_15348 [Limosa lapponica baueri]|uniref:Uncharacterized protein n=1 Tax=Limosa lapponica baueri TaxID=1758121 RepID=A0A2I0TKM6_LIMLA|nr:hypothetical protein llap_15348 [Limosa lapponica baueri]
MVNQRHIPGSYCHVSLVTFGNRVQGAEFVNLVQHPLVLQKQQASVGFGGDEAGDVIQNSSKGLNLLTPCN